MKGHIRRRGAGSWAIVVDLGRNAHGKRHQKWQTVHGTKRDAERELSRLLHSIHSGSFVEPTRTTVGEYLERWLQDYAKANVSAKTFERYQDIVRKDLVPSLGQVALAKLQPLQIQTYYSEALQKGRSDGRGGLSATTVLQHHRVLRQALQHALRWQLLARNPADAVEPPRKVQHEMRALSEEETVQLLKAADGKRLYLPILLAVMTGLRRGEILGLRWSDVDLKAHTLAVMQTVEQTRQGIAFKRPKTNKGRRLIVLPALVVEALRSPIGLARTKSWSR